MTQIVRSVAREGKEGLVVKTSDAGKPLNWSCGKKLPNNIGLVAKRQTDFPGRNQPQLAFSREREYTTAVHAVAGSLM